MAGNRTNAMATTPAVAPKPSSQRNVGDDWTSSRLGASSMTERASSNMAITTTLLSTGAHAAAKKCRRAFSNAVAMAVIP